MESGTWQRGEASETHMALAIGERSAAHLAHCRHGHSTQTRRSAAARATNVADTFRATTAARRLASSSPHILLVDDIITTGSTMRDCLRALSSAIPDARLSVLSIGIAHGL